jgi:hypothetical protein
MGTCPSCQRPAPNGEIKLWEHCGFCHRQKLAEQVSEPLDPDQNRSGLG